MTNFENIKIMVKNNGFDSMMAMLAEAKVAVEKEEEGYKEMISPKEYGGVGVGSGISFPDWVEETFKDVIEKTGIGVWEFKGNSGSRAMSITHSNFAKYVIQTSGNGIMLENIIEILTSAPAWCGGRGLTRQRMEMVFHILVLHKEDLTAVKDELKKLLRRYDPVALKVFANDDDDFRHTLNYEAKMISFAEKKVCERIGKVTEFKVA